VIFVSHDRSLVALGGSKGFSKARNNGLLELQLEAIIDPVTGDPMPAMKGKLKYPGKVAIEVEISTEMNGSMDFAAAPKVEDAAPAATPEQQDIRAKLEGLYHETPETNSVSESDCGNDVLTPETNSVTDCNDAVTSLSAFRFNPETKIVSLPETETVSVTEVETMLFQAICEGYENRYSPSDIVKQSLRLGKDRYQEGRSLCVYLIRKYGQIELLMHFRRWLNED
jgi:hypothetical protein